MITLGKPPHKRSQDEVSAMINRTQALVDDFHDSESKWMPDEIGYLLQAVIAEFIRKKGIK